MGLLVKHCVCLDEVLKSSEKIFKDGLILAVLLDFQCL